MNCPACGKPDLEPIRLTWFIAEYGDVWECPNCTLLSTDFAVKMYNRNELR